MLPRSLLVIFTTDAFRKVRRQVNYDLVCLLETILDFYHTLKPALETSFFKFYFYFNLFSYYFIIFIIYTYVVNQQMHTSKVNFERI
jgi:hypothetical protein